MKQFQVGPARLRNGWEARIYALDGGPGWPIHGAIQKSTGIWTPTAWTEQGRNQGCSDGIDLLPNAAPVVSDAALDAFYKAARGWGDNVSSPRDEFDNNAAAGLAAAFAVMLAERGE